MFFYLLCGPYTFLSSPPLYFKKVVVVIKIYNNIAIGSRSTRGSARGEAPQNEESPDSRGFLHAFTNFIFLDPI